MNEDKHAALLGWCWQVKGEVLGKKTCPSASLSNTNLTWNGLESKRGVHGEKPTTNVLAMERSPKTMYCTYNANFRRGQCTCGVESSWNVMAHGDAREGKWRGNWRMEWVTSTLHTTSEHGVSSINATDTHTSAASSRLNWRHRADLNGLAPFRRKTKSGFCACAVTFQTQSNNVAGFD